MLGAPFASKTFGMIWQRRFPFTLLCAYPLKTFPKTLTLARTNRWHCPQGASLTKLVQDALKRIRESCKDFSTVLRHCNGKPSEV
jgi:hypothetical protein